MMSKEDTICPVVYEYPELSCYLKARFQWLKQNRSGYSLRSEVAKCTNVSIALASQILSGKRRLTRERLPSMSKILHLQDFEEDYIDQILKGDPFHSPSSPSKIKPMEKERSNHLLADWLHVYVKDACRLKGFVASPLRIYELLHGIAPLKRIQKSLDFLMKEGYLRKDARGKMVLDEDLSRTTSPIPNQKIRKFHKKALDLAKQGFEKYPMQKRWALTMVTPLDEEELAAVKAVLEETQEKLHQIALESKERQSEDHEPQRSSKKKRNKDYLYQIILNLTPVGGGKNVQMDTGGRPVH